MAKLKADKKRKSVSSGNQSMNRMQQEVDSMGDMSDEELAEKGIIRVKAFTRSDGVKIKTHYRKIGK